MKRIFNLVSALMLSSTMMAASVQTSANNVTIRPDGGQAKVISLEVMNDNIIRVRATSKDALPVKPASLMIVPQAAPAKGSYSVTEDADNVVVKAKNVKAVVSKATGQSVSSPRMYAFACSKNACTSSLSASGLPSIALTTVSRFDSSNPKFEIVIPSPALSKIVSGSDFAPFGCLMKYDSRSSRPSSLSL